MNGRILIADGSPANRILCRGRLDKSRFAISVTTDGAECLSLARRERPDLLLLNLPLPDLSAERILRELRADPLLRATPIIVTLPESDSSTRLAALNAGADDVLARPVDDGVLQARLRSLLRLCEERGMVRKALGHQDSALVALAEPGADFDHPGAIGLIAQSHETAVAWQQQLSGRLRDRLQIYSPAQALALSPSAAKGVPDIFVIETGSSNSANGLRLMSAMRGYAGTRHSAYCIVHDAPGSDADATTMALDLGADDVISTAQVGAELAPRLRALLRRKRQADRLRATLEDGLRMAVIDPLTGTHNRRYAMPRMAGIAAQARAEGSDFAVMVIDIDRFKSVNDTHGHMAGDTVLVEIARRLTENLRDCDLLARIGGEEFLVVLPQTGMVEATRVAEQLRQIVGGLPIAIPDGESLRVTISIGLTLGAAFLHDSNGELDIMELVNAADQALLASKSAGRNLVTFGKTAA